MNGGLFRIFRMEDTRTFTAVYEMIHVYMSTWYYVYTWCVMEEDTRILLMM